MQRYKSIFNHRYKEAPRKRRRFHSRRRAMNYLPQLAMLAAGALLLLLAYGCAKEGPAGPIGYPGATGPKGEQGEKADIPPYTAVNVIDPCGDAPNLIDEILLVLANGQVLVSFSDHKNGNNTRLALLPPGTYVTTDGSNCAFTVTSDGQITY